MPSTTTGGSPPALLAGRSLLALPAGRASAETAFELQVLVPGRLLALIGRLDVRVCADVRLAFAEAVREGQGDLVLDLSGLGSIDATGLGVLVGGHRAAGRTGRVLVLRDVPAPVGRLLLLTRLDRVLQQSRTA